MERQETKLNKKELQKTHLHTSPIYNGAHGMSLRSKKRNPPPKTLGQPWRELFANELFIYLFIHLFIYSFIHLSIYSFIHFSIYLSIYLFIYFIFREAGDGVIGNE